MYNVNEIDDMINKSLESVDELTKKSEDLTKAMPEENKTPVTPNEVSEGAGVEGTPDEDTEGVEGDVPTEGAEEPSTDEDEMPMAKSLMDSLNENEDVKKALEVSDFLNELSKGMSDILNNHGDSLSKSLEASNKTSMLLAKSFQGIVASQQSVISTQATILKSLNALTSRLETVESTPMTRKSLASTPVVAVEKDFKKSLATQEPTKELSKSEVLAKLEGEFSKGNMSLTNDILRYESTGDLNCLSDNARKVLGQ